MNLEQMRARLAEISARIGEIEPGEQGYSAEQQKEIDDLSAEADKLSGQIDTAERAQAVKDKAASSAGRKTVAAAPAPTQAAREVTVTSRNDKLGGFASAGEWFMAVKRAAHGDIDKRFQNAVLQEKIGEDGGFLVPEEISSAILKKMEGDESLMARCNVTQVSGNSLSLQVDENQPWTGGITAYWVGEGQSITSSKPNFKQAQFRLQKVAALVYATDELLEDATALASYIGNNAPAAIMHQVNKAILSGNGAGKPQGIINSPFTYTVSKESMQSADTVLAENVLKMYSRMFPGSRANAAWFIHPQVEEQLRLLEDGAGNYIYLAPGGQMNQTPYGSLLGRPVIPLMGGMPAIGDLGDILFADLSYYYMIRKASGVKSATSIHMNFDKEQTAFRFSLRLDGRCPFQAPVTTENGNYKMSAFVQLEAR